MRRELILVFVAISTMIVIAFVVPLGFSTGATARDRATDSARAESAALVPFVATGDSRTVFSEVDRVNGEGRLAVTVVMADGTEVGADVPDRARLEAVINQAVSLTGPTDGGQEIVTAVVLPEGQAAVRVFVSDRELRSGVAPAWAILGALGISLVLLAVALADRVAQRVIGPVERLAEAAAVLGDGDFSARVEPEGPPELQTTAGAFNSLVGRVHTMVEEERAMVSELTHRLRTPLTRLRVDLDRIEDTELAAKLHQAVDALTTEVNDLIARARHTVTPPELVDIEKVVRDRFEFWAVLAAEEGRPCTLDADGPFMISVETDELEAAVDVLLENVFAHTSATTAFEVSVRLGTATGCCLVVEDAGPGFDAELIEAGRSGSGSTGLGLAIVKRLLNRSGGTLTLASGRLGGARVECCFPGSDGGLPVP